MIPPETHLRAETVARRTNGALRVTPVLRGVLWGALTVLVGGGLGYRLLSLAPRPASVQERPTLRGVVSLDPSVIASPGDIVFLTVRAAGQSGPPLAVQRLVAAELPKSFEMGPADSMLGRPWPRLLALDAYLDSDGDPRTRTSDAPAAHLGSVTAGSANLRLMLERPKAD